jgi:peptidoglycan/LPS O-acetylase OafA/YrhL
MVSPGSLFVSTDWGILRAAFSFFAGCLVYDLRLRSGDRLKAPNLWEACCLAMIVAFAATTPSGGSQYAFPLAAMVTIYVFSFDQGAISTVLRCSALQKLGLWSYSIYMIHTFLFQVMKMGVSFIGQKAKIGLVGWHNGEKLMLLGTPDQALLPTLILCVVLVVPVAALTYRWIEKPAMDTARRGLSVTSGGISRPAPWLRALSARRIGLILRWRAGLLAVSARDSLGLRS